MEILTWIEAFNIFPGAFWIQPVKQSYRQHDLRQTKISGGKSPQLIEVF